MIFAPPISTSSLRGSCPPEARVGQILHGYLQLSEVLGVGAYGVVYKAFDHIANAPCAVKVLDKIGLEPRHRKLQQREIELHIRANAHPNVVSLTKILDFDDCTFVAMEYCPDGDLFSNITECFPGKYFGHDGVKDVFLQILDAVDHCHSIGVYHRDLKPENIMMSGMIVKLADFGLATTDRYTSDFSCGSTFYMSPECQQSSPNPYSYYDAAQNDVWSLGVILVNLTCGRNPWKKASYDDATFKAYLKDPDFLMTILPISVELNCVLKKIFAYNPADRPSIQELKNLIVNCPNFMSPLSPSPLDYSNRLPFSHGSDCSCLDCLGCRTFMCPPSEPSDLKSSRSTDHQKFQFSQLPSSDVPSPLEYIGSSGSFTNCSTQSGEKIALSPTVSQSNQLLQVSDETERSVGASNTEHIEHTDADPSAVNAVDPMDQISNSVQAMFPRLAASFRGSTANFTKQMLHPVSHFHSFTSSFQLR